MKKKNDIVFFEESLLDSIIINYLFRCSSIFELSLKSYFWMMVTLHSGSWYFGFSNKSVELSVCSRVGPIIYNYE